jgi:hypothetical protein
MQFFSSWPSFKTVKILFPHHLDHRGSPSPSSAQVRLHSQIVKKSNHLAARRGRDLNAFPVDQGQSVITVVPV